MRTYFEMVYLDNALKEEADIITLQLTANGKTIKEINLKMTDFSLIDLTVQEKSK